MAITEDVKSNWYKALFEEDCMVVMKLLVVHCNLLKIGWYSDSSRQVEGRRRREGVVKVQTVGEGLRRRSPWKGRTALHVGASRGCTQLILQVLRLCNVDVSNIDEAYQKKKTLLQEFSFNITCAKCKISPIVGNRWKSTVKPDYNLCPSCYEKHENEKSEFIECIEFGWNRLANDKIKEKAAGVWVSDLDVKELLLAKDGECGLDARAIATLHCNQEIVSLFYYVESNLLDVTSSPDYFQAMKDKFLECVMENADKRKLLRKVVTQSGFLKEAIVVEFNKHRDFNFLPPEEYLFHFMYAKQDTRWLSKQKLWTAVRSCEGELWRFLLELKDGQGRPPFHVAMEEFREKDFLYCIMKENEDKDGQGRPPSHDFSEEDFLLCIREGNKIREVVICAITTPDAAGRTPIRRAAARGLVGTIQIILEGAVLNEEVAATCYAPWCHKSGKFSDESFNEVSIANDFPPYHQQPHTPLHAAMIHGNFDCVELLIKKWRQLDWGDMTYRTVYDDLIRNILIGNLDEPKTWRGCPEKVDTSVAAIGWDIVELACLVKAPAKFIGFLIDFLEVDLKMQREVPNIAKFREKLSKVGVIDKRPDIKETTLTHLWHPLHIVASSGKYDLVQYFIDDRHCTPFLEDFEGNSALHHAMKTRDLELKIHLMDYVDSEHVHCSRHSASRMVVQQVLDDKFVAERQECINVLLQAGCDVFKPNKRKQLPSPTGSLNDVKLLSWWHDKQHQRFQTTQSKLNSATNAIAVTAALVATASYVGPLQPPMGYDASQIQYQNVWVSLFIVSDTLSFYCAIVAITLSVIPSLPMPEQGPLEELERTRRMVIWAAAILLPSILFVFVAFASSSISVMSANITSEVGGISTIVSTLIGVVFCVLAFTFFFIRLLAFLYPRKQSIRKLYH